VDALEPGAAQELALAFGHGPDFPAEFRKGAQVGEDSGPRVAADEVSRRLGLGIEIVKPAQVARGNASAFFVAASQIESLPRRLVQIAAGMA